MTLQTLAYFLPQFHACPYNEKWWGAGFTEWTNVRQAQPLKPGHLQPRVPDGGEFDLASPAEIARQFATAKAAGIAGFVFYHYWYDGARPLGRPLDLILDDPSVDLRFSLCWANHSWTRTWRNRRGALDVLIAQTYGATAEARERHYAYLCRCFADPRYIRLGDQPLFQVYVPEDVDQFGRYCDELRSYCLREIGVTPHIAGSVRRHVGRADFMAHCDSLTLAQPTLGLFGPDDPFQDKPAEPGGWLQLRRALLDLPLPVKRCLYTLQDLMPKRPHWHDYDAVWGRILAQSQAALHSSPRPLNVTGFVDFDNTPRYRKAARVMEGFSPEAFGRHMAALSGIARQTDNQLLFVNAWNEWGEGMHLQGDTRWPHERLSALDQAVRVA